VLLLDHVARARLALLAVADRVALEDAVLLAVRQSPLERDRVGRDVDRVEACDLEGEKKKINRK
jgi:hypothetical protein